ncbi:MAG: hypothetical protein FIA92_13820 [Chloroflexi bacterium]|nr:hypothetical protein [Chloroflexota bacterium]
MTKLLVAAFLLAHGAIHAAFIGPRPPATAGGPAWPFELARSWLLTPAGFDADITRALGLALTAATLGGFALAALAVVGVLPIGVWFPTLFLGTVASIALLVLFFHPWLALGLVIDLGLLWLALAADWTPASILP